MKTTKPVANIIPFFNIKEMDFNNFLLNFHHLLKNRYISLELTK